MKLSGTLRKAVQPLILVSIPFLLLGVNQLLSREFANVRVLAGEVEQAHLTREQLTLILSVHKDIESGERGYVITRDPVFLEPYNAAAASVDSEFARLETLAAGAPVVRAGLRGLRELSERKRAFSRRTVDLAREGRQSEAARLIASRQGKITMDALRARIQALESEVQRQADASSATRVAARVRTQRVALALQSLLVIMLILAAWQVARSLRAERRTAAGFRDLSARQEAIFDAAIDGLILHDDQGVIDSVNPATAHMYGYDDPGDLVGRHLDILFEKPPAREQLRAYLRRLAAGPEGSSSAVREFEGRRKDGSNFPVDVVTSPVVLDGGTFFLGAVRDATERKRVEEMKNEFVSTVSHELRTPLTSIAGSLGLLSGGAAGPLPDKAARLIKIARDNSERLVRLINDILDIEKIESGKMAFHLTWVRLAPLLQQAVQANRGFAAQYGVELELAPVAEDAAVIADEDRLIQVVTNLLSNAAKFSPAGEKVRVEVTALGEKNRISVLDHGPGIPEAFRSRMFGKFAQADASDTRTKGGSGLGLSIVREIVTRLGGSVSFDDAPGGGTAFHVDLPAAQAAHAARDLSVQGRPGLPRILHVDDDLDTLRVVASAFDGQAEVYSTPSVREGYAALRRNGFDAAILDVAMADGSGLDLLPLLRDEGRATPTILFTMHDTNPGYEAQVDAVLTKSRSTLDGLVGVVMGLIEERG